MITLGVSDLERAQTFYADWGWEAHAAEGSIVFYQLNGLALALFPLAMLVEDQARGGDAVGTGAMTLAQNFPVEADVDKRFEAALAAGATALKRPEKTEWGGYSGYISDPDGHVWELAVNPFWELGEDGAVTMPRGSEPG